LGERNKKGWSGKTLLLLAGKNTTTGGKNYKYWREKYKGLKVVSSEMDPAQIRLIP
jgi:hypothetical protein